MEKDLDFSIKGCATLRDTTTFIIDYEENEKLSDPMLFGKHWQEYFFKLMSYKNSYSGCRELTIRSNYHSENTWIVMVVDSDKVYPFENIVENLFEKFEKRETKELVFDSYDFSKIAEVDDIFVD